MFEVNPVLAGKFGTVDYAAAASNIAPAATTAPDAPSASDTTTSNVDSRRYTQFDRTATETGTVEMSFGDFLDMINPLQHIPIVSSAYRAVTGDTINPVSRVAGDIMYSAPLGPISAAISGVSAIANNIMESQTGTDGVGIVLASLFGKDKTTGTTSDTQPTMLADATTPQATATPDAPEQLLTAAATPVTTTEIAAAASSSTPASTVAETAPTNTAMAMAAAPTTSPLGAPNSKFLPLDRTRMNPKDPTASANDIESQNRIIALSEGSRTMRLGHTIYTSAYMNGPKPMPARSTTPAPATVAATAPAPISTTVAAAPSATPDISLAAEAAANATASATTATTDTTSAAVPAASTPMPATSSIVLPPSNQMASSSSTTSMLSAQRNVIPPALFDDVMIMKRLSQYKSFATAPVTNGATLDITN